ncbi:MAG: ATP-binding protein [Candidatus Schekmanbacteria bacterium]|nr:ATP-binding protein [Candidatus Schekmanbacteria bacterium]
MVNTEGKTEQARRCQCFMEKYRQRLWEKSGVPKNFRNCRLSNYDVYKTDKNKRTVDNDLSIPKEICANFANKYPVIEQGLLLMGTIGVGKTHLAVGIIAELTLNKGVPCLFYDFRDLLKTIQSSYDPRSQISETSVLEPVVNAEVLVLDELGARKVTDWMLDMLTHIINKRYNDKRITIITTNYVDNPLQKEEESLTDRVGYRIRSRLCEMCVELQIKGKDYREGKKSKFNFNF